jgi:hypothetical protein
MAGRIFTIELTDRCAVGETVAVVSCGGPNKNYQPRRVPIKKSSE